MFVLYVCGLSQSAATLQNPAVVANSATMCACPGVPSLLLLDSLPCGRNLYQWV